MLEGLDTQTRLIYEPVKEGLTHVEEKLRQLSADEGTFPHLSELLDYVLQSKGKRVRPAVTLLASQVHPGPTDLPVLMAAAVELLHIATLIHDDTVDNSALRRGKATVSNLWGQNVAVLLGDYVFAASATLVCDTRNVRVIRRFAETIMALSSGELLEYFHSFSWQQTRQDYEERISRKTASLFRTACETGAILSGAPEEHVAALSTYGHNLGMAFQVVDDILDYEGDPLEVGKPVGNDLLQGVVTLPALMLMERYPVENPIRVLFESRGDGLALKRVLEMVHNSTILEECYAQASGYCQQAAAIAARLPEGPYRRSLLEITSYVMSRRR